MAESVEQGPSTSSPLISSASLERSALGLKRKVDAPSYERSDCSSVLYTLDTTLSLSLSELLEPLL